MSENINYSTEERAEQQNIEELKELLNQKIKHLKNTAPYEQFQELLEYLTEKR